MRYLFLAVWVLGTIARNFGAEMHDNFSNSTVGWSSSPRTNWMAVEISPGQFVYRGDLAGDALAEKTNVVLESSWILDVDTKIRKYYAGNRGVASLALFPEGSGVRVEANANQLSDGSVQLDVSWFDTTNATWHTTFVTPWLTAKRDATYHLQLMRSAGSDSLRFTVTAGDFFFSTNSPTIPAAFLDKMKHPALRANYGLVDFSNFSVITPIVSFDPMRAAYSRDLGYRLRILAPAGETIRLEGSTNLIEWEPVAVLPNAASSVELIDPGALNLRQRFYRVVLP